MPGLHVHAAHAAPPEPAASISLAPRASGGTLLSRLTVRPVVVTPALDASRLIHGWTQRDDGALLTPRLTLRPLAESDATAFIELSSRARHRVGAFLPIYAPGEEDQAMFARQLAAAVAGDASGRAWRRVLELRQSGSITRLIGCVHLNSIQRGMTLDADLSCWLDQPYEGRGLAAEAVGAAIAFAIADLPEGLGLHRVHAGVAPTNVRSAALLLRLGFRRDDTKQSMLRVGDRWERHDFYAFDAPIEPFTSAGPPGSSPA